MKVYFNSCVVIYLVEQVTPWHQIIHSSLSSQVTVCTSNMVLLECLVQPIKQQDQVRQNVYRSQLVSYVTLDLTRDVYELAVQIRATHGIPTPDAMHLAVAEINQCDEFWTNDLRLRKASSTLTIRAIGPQTGTI